MMTVLFAYSPQRITGDITCVFVLNGPLSYSLTRANWYDYFIQRERNIKEGVAKRATF